MSESVNNNRKVLRRNNLTVYHLGRVTYHENAYNYFEHKDDFGLRFLSAMDIVENPMVVFE